MAVKLVCDRCGTEAGEIETFGLVRKIEACKDCAPDIRKFLEERDALHGRVQKTWTTGLASLAKKYKGPLPDVP